MSNLKNMKRSLIVFHVLTMFQSIANNLAHPVTPTFINNLQLRDSMFGIAFAMMALGIFLFSLFYGQLTVVIKKSIILCFSMVGYALAQYMFMSSTTELQIIFARLLAGFFTAGFQVAQLNYLVSQSDPEERGFQLTLSSILIIASSTIGFFIGGVAGDYSVSLAFMIQIVMCVVIGILYFVLLHRREVLSTKQSFSWANANPFISIKKARHLLTPAVVIVMVSIFFTWLGGVSFDQTFNYYIRDVFNFKPSYNGYLKMATGVMGILSNFTISMALIKYTNLKKSYALLMLVMSGVGWITVVARTQSLFLVMALLFFAIDAMSKPLQQAMVANMSSDDDESHILMGLYNTIKSLGMILGALVAGLLYEINVLGPFTFASLALLISAVLMWRHYQIKNAR